jgi:rhamnosyltransferase
MSETAIRIAAVVVTFHPEQNVLSELVRAVIPQTDGLVIVDNTEGTADGVAAAIPNDSSVAVIRNESNVGLGRAQNQGSQWAMERGFTHVFMLDQDSVPAADCVANLRQAEKRLRAEGKSVAAVGPRVLDRRSGRAYSFKQFKLGHTRRRVCVNEAELIPCDFLIASGSLIRAEALRQVGPMDEGLFIDRIDIDWCLRAAAKDHSTYGVCSAKMLHEPGQQARRVWLGRWVEFALHSPLRTYYMVRNSLLLYRRPYATAHWIVADALWLIGIVLLSCLFAPDRLQRIALACNAIQDGLRCVDGPLPGALHPNGT